MSQSSEEPFPGYFYSSEAAKRAENIQSAGRKAIFKFAEGSLFDTERSPDL
ncbi:MAG: hypothetical protein ACO3OM_10680 [Alphaproteobacteria bacterium]